MADFDIGDDCGTRSRGMGTDSIAVLANLLPVSFASFRYVSSACHLFLGAGPWELLPAMTQFPPFFGLLKPLIAAKFWPTLLLCPGDCSAM